MPSKEEFLELATAKYDKVEKSQEIKSFYDHEKTFDEVWTEYGREILEKSISETPKDRRKKTCAVTER